MSRTAARISRTALLGALGTGAVACADMLGIDGDYSLGQTGADSGGSPSFGGNGGTDPGGSGGEEALGGANPESNGGAKTASGGAETANGGRTEVGGDPTGGGSSPGGAGDGGESSSGGAASGGAASGGASSGGGPPIDSPCVAGTYDGTYEGEFNLPPAFLGAPPGAPVAIIGNLHLNFTLVAGGTIRASGTLENPPELSGGVTARVEGNFECDASTHSLTLVEARVHTLIPFYDHSIEGTLTVDDVSSGNLSGGFTVTDAGGGAFTPRGKGQATWSAAK
jgi:hypothetical protein